MNIELLTEIKRKGLSQRTFAQIVGDHETLVSRVINGHWNLDPARKAKYAKVLGCKVQELFENNDSKRVSP